MSMNKKYVCEVLVRKKEMKNRRVSRPHAPPGLSHYKTLHVAHEIFAYNIAIKRYYDNFSSSFLLLMVCSAKNARYALSNKLKLKFSSQMMS
jgi:hypothetical protein